ncbi:putative cytochrome P450 [Arabidopsis thaliana]
MTMKHTIALALLLILSFLFTYLILVAVKSRRRRSSSLALLPGPPGPSGWPIIGNLLQIIGKAPHRSFADLSRVYGPVMSLRLGSLTTVVISSPDAAREVLKTLDHVLSGRTFSETVRAFGHHEVSIAWLPSTSSRWSRKRLLGGHCSCLLRHITSLNVISNVVFSTDLGSYDAKASTELQDSLSRMMKIMGKPNLANYFPSLEFLDLQGIRKEMKVCSERFFQVFQGLIDARIAERSSQTGPRDALRGDLLDSLIDLIQEERSEVDMNDINHFLCDLFIAGTETNSTTVEWALAELLRNPEAMANAKVEINFIVGPNRYVRDSNLLEFPYLQAVVTETLRLHPPTPFLIPRRAESDLEILGYPIPENAQILVNAWAIGRDPTVGENAEQFEPERFLGRDIEMIGKDFEMIPFGAGLRICPGISLALRIVPLMLASLIYSFEWYPKNVKNEVVPEDLNMDETLGFTLHKAEPIYSDTLEKAYNYFY